MYQEEKIEEVEEEVVHEENDWGISLVSEDTGELDGSVPTLAAGITVAYSMKTPAVEEEDTGPGAGAGAEETSLEELMNQMKSM